MELTDRQKQVVEHVVNGEKRQAIAHGLGISVWTVDFHLVRIRRKFGVNSMLEIAVLFSAQHPSNKS
jgi:DNA-binding CsgD family transcriptional regulator